MKRIKIGIVTAIICLGIIAGWTILRIQPSLRESEAAKESQIEKKSDRPESLSRDEAREALIALAESQEDPISYNLTDLHAGKIRYLPDNEEGVSSGTWTVDLSKRTFSWFIAGGRLFYEISGEFQKDGTKWKAVITGTRQT